MPPTLGADDRNIADNTILWRRVNPEMIKWDEHAKRYLPTSNLFRDSTGKMSVNIASLTTIDATLEGYPNYSIIQFDAGFARSLGCIIVRDPVEGNPAHALVCSNSKITKAGARTLAERSTWAHLVIPDKFQKSE